MSEQLLVTPDTPWGYLGGIGGDIPHFGGYFSTAYFITLMFMTLGVRIFEKSECAYQFWSFRAST